MYTLNLGISVDIVTGLQAGRPGGMVVRFSIGTIDLSVPQRAQSSCKALTPPIRQASENLSSEAKQPGREAGHFGVVSRFTNEWRYMSTAPLCLSGTHRYNFIRGAFKF